MIDWGRIKELRDEIGANELLEIVDIFLEEVSANVEALSEVSDRQLGDSLHAIRGSALNLGFQDLAALCQKGENLVATGAEKDVNRREISDSFLRSRSVFDAEMVQVITDRK